MYKCCDLKVNCLLVDKVNFVVFSDYYTVARAKSAYNIKKLYEWKSLQYY